MNILFASGYANYDCYDRNFGSRNMYKTQMYDKRGNRNGGRNSQGNQRFISNTNKNFVENNCSNGNKQYSYNGSPNTKMQGNFNNNNRNSSNNYYRNHRNYKQNYSNQNYLFRQPMPEPMDVNMICNLRNPINTDTSQTSSIPKCLDNFSIKQNSYSNQYTQNVGNNLSRNPLPQPQDNFQQIYHANQLPHVATVTETAQNFLLQAYPEGYRI